MINILYYLGKSLLPPAGICDNFRCRVQAYCEHGFYMARRRLCLLGLLQVWLVNGMALLFGCVIRQFSLAINRLGSKPKVENHYPIIKAICYTAIRCEIQKQ